jgi:hypothetical protein
MSTGEGPDARDDRDRNDHGGRADRIGIGGGDDSVTRIQLAARWAEAYGPSRDSLGGVLKRFRAAYEYLDAVTHGVEPSDLQEEVAATQPVAAPAYAAPAQQQAAPTFAQPPSPPAPPPPAPEPRPW